MKGGGNVFLRGWGCGEEEGGGGKLKKEGKEKGWKEELRMGDKMRLHDLKKTKQ